MGRAAKRGDGAGEEWVESTPQRVIAITLRRLKADQKALSHTDHWTVCISVVNPQPGSVLLLFSGTARQPRCAGDS